MAERYIFQLVCIMAAEPRLQDEAEEVSERRLHDIPRAAARSKDGHADEPQQHVGADSEGAEPATEHDAREQREQELQRKIIAAGDRDTDKRTDRDQCDKQPAQS